MLTVPFFSLPNLLAGERLVEELVQDEVNAENLAAKTLALLHADATQHAAESPTGLDGRYRDIHRTLLGGASTKAAQAVLDLLAAPARGIRQEQ
jgi:lipid-A-disaccharide synthase